MAKIGSLTVDLTLKSAEFIRDLSKSSKAVATHTNLMRKSFDAVRQSTTALVGGLAGLASVKAIKQMARLTEESLRLAAAMDGPLTSAAKNFLSESENVSNAFQLGVAQGFFDNFNTAPLSSEENLRTVNELGASLGKLMEVSFTVALQAAAPFAGIVRQIAVGLQYIATHTPAQALADITGAPQPMGELDFNKMTAEIGSGVTAWDAYAQATKRANQEIANTAKTIQVTFPDVAKMHEQMRLQSIETTGQWLDVADTVGQALGTMFKENKAVAIVQAVINTAQAITEALKLPFPINWAQVAAVSALGAAQIATISSANPGSSKALRKTGGGGGGAGAARAGNASRGGGGSFTQAVTISIVGDVFGPEHFRKIAAGLNDVQRDGTALLRVA